ncbi:CDP-glycerol glycerophosphotransferase family protein [Lactiplantibacillus sp. WILCCON 0030]|uniref:CDP-glycerol glycerophosphotransferase family protein n=1 Tax=Lactiplantibacillus brownii TaxID=3069269 RepID=A0ABU1A506_9LACO|nr:CDP-glycerol glycerophosphotransferase family protein [Lactiplantibacillus brownii]MDQ7936084.1 CDP-glycerol glycerophosphotransferase family protein [Lactiplantibacillus brownii]
MANYVKKAVALLKKAKRTYYITWYRNAFLQHHKLEKTVLIESTHGNDFYGHMYYLTQSLRALYPEMNLNVAVAKTKLTAVRQQLDRLGMQDVKVVQFLGHEYCTLLASAEYLLNDTSFYPFFIKQDFQQYINIWHGTPLKCLGKDDGDVPNMGNIQKNFYNADKLIVSNDYTRQAMIDSFNLDGVMKGDVVVAPSPRNSVLCNDELRQTVRERYQLENQEVLVYMPTWRGGVAKVLNESLKITPYLKQMDAALNDDQVLFVKLHPFQAQLENIDFSPYRHLKPFPMDIESYEFLAGTDGLITDYSSIMYDYLNTGKPVVLFSYDKDHYYAERGCYEDIDNYPLPQFRTIERLCEWLKNGSREKTYDEAFAKRFISLDNRDGDRQLARYIIEGTTDFGSVKIDPMSPDNGRETVIMHVGTLWGNGITSALFNTLTTVDVTKRNYLVFINKNRLTADDQWRLFNLPAGVQFFPVPLGPANNLAERLVVMLFLRFEKLNHRWFQRVADRCFRREYRRLFGDLKPSAFIHYTGYERNYAEMISALAPTEVKTSIYMHNDMIAEKRSKGKGMNWAILTRAYRMVDHLVFVDAAQRDDFLKVYPAVSKQAVVVDNFIGSQTIQAKSKAPLVTTLLEAPVIVSHAPAILRRQIQVKTTLRLELDRPASQVAETAMAFLGVETAQFDHLAAHIAESTAGLRQALPAKVQLPNEFEMSARRTVSLLGLTRSQLLDDLYNPQLKVFVNIGRMAAVKSHERLIHSFIAVHRQNPKTRLVIIASYGDMQAAIEQWIADSGCADAIYFLGRMSNPYVVLRLADAFVFTSLYESLGLVAFEALAVGTDVVTVSIPATNARLQPGNALVVANDQAEITKSWLAYLAHGYDRTTMDFAADDQRSIHEFEQLF